MPCRKTFRRAMRLATAAAALSAAAAPAAENPVLQFRLESGHTSSDAAWAATFEMLRQVPGLCDEIWFGTGFGMPTPEKHRENAERIRRAAEDVRALGWSFALQIQATIGHGGPFAEGQDYSGRNWTGWTGSTGVEDKCCNCPRDPRFLAYMREMARTYAALRPASVWIDDDLRIDNHLPATRGSLDGCWCDRCIAAFNAESGGRWTRKTLDAAARRNPRLRVAYEEFSIRSVAAVARAIGEEFHAVSPETRLALQHGAKASRTIAAATGALRDAAGGRPAGFRPGGGAYYDDDPNAQLEKVFELARCRRDCAFPDRIGFWTSEIACWPRTYGSRSAQSIVVEAFAALMYGMDAASALVVNFGKEDEATYLRARLAPMAAAAPVLREYAKSSEGTLPAGFGCDAGAARLYRFAQCAVPVLPGPGRPCGRLSARDIALDRRTAASAAVQRLRDALDARAGGTPAVAESPFAGLMLPRVAPDGGLRNVALVNVRIGPQGPVRLRLRGVPGGAQTAVWREIGRAPALLPIVREGGACRVEIPSIGAWNGGFLDFRRSAEVTAPACGK